jgi:hypothetical protein
MEVFGHGVWILAVKDKSMVITVKNLQISIKGEKFLNLEANISFRRTPVLQLIR